MKILIATKNKGKFNEISGVLSTDDVETIFLGDLSIEDADFVEDGDTHEANSYKKAKYYFDKLGADFDFVLGEDSGIYVDVLGDELGVKTRRWGLGESVSDKEWLEYFMKVMGERAVGDEARGAKFVCNACVVGRKSDGSEFCEFFEGETYGKIVNEIAQEVLPGLPLSSVFLPDGFDRVYAVLTREEKNTISHRGRAIGKLNNFLKNL